MADLSGYNWNENPRDALNQPELNVEPDDEASVLGDLALAVPRGIVGAGQDAYGLLDTIAFDALPDWTENPLGESETVAGGLLEGVTNFATGFIPILGQVGKVGKLGKFGRYAVAGALTDFTVFDGNEARLSNLLRDYAGLEDPVTEFLAADEDDPEIVGRLKNALEGFGIGTAVDLLALSLRGVKKYRSKIAEGKSKEAAAREVASEIKAEEFQAAYETARVADETQPRAAMDEAVEQVDEAVEEAPVKAPTPEVNLDAQLRSIGVDPTVITPDEIQKAIAVRARQFENAGIDPAVNPRKLNEAELAITALSEKGLNLRDVRDYRDAALVARTAEMLLPVKKAQTMEDVWAQAKEWADDTGQDPQKLMLELQGLGQEAGLLVRKMSVARAVYKQHLTTATQQWREVRSKGGTQEQIAEAMLRFQNLLPIQKALQDVRSNFGLGLGSLGHDLGNSIITREMAEKMILDAGGEANVHNMLDALADAFEKGGAGAATAIAKETVAKKFWNVSYEMWIQGLLSHPRTAVVSATSAAVGTIYRPFELLMGGAMQSLRLGRSTEALHAAIAQLSNLQEAVPAAWKAAKSSWLTEQNRLAGAGMIDNDRRAITAERLGLTDSPYAAMIDSIGKVVRTPGRILAAQDEGFGTLTYRSIVKERLETQMLAEYGSKGLPREEALAAAAAQLDKMVVDGMAYSRGSLYQKAFADAKAANPGGNASMWKQAAQEHVAQNFDPKLGALAEYAIKSVQRDVTMTAPLSIHSQNPLSSSAARLQGLVESTPILKLFAPFIRTPTNIAIWGTQRFDVVGFGKALALQTFPDSMPKTLGAKHRFVQDIMSQDPIRKAEALGRLMTGVAVTSSIATLAYNGSVTGRGPKDPNLRKILEASGWQPYSVKIGNTYYSYARLDPLATMLGTIADSMEWSKWAPEEDRGEAATLAWGFAVGMANNVTNKTYFTGLMRLTEVLSDPANAVEKTARSYAGSAVPNLLASLVPSLGDDDYMREARTYTDSILRKVPGYSDSLAPRRNILGEPVAWNRVLGDEVGGDFASIFSPIAASAVSDDLIWKELSTLERAFEAPRRTRNGMDLTTYVKANGQDAYDRWQELAGTTPIRGLKLRDALRKLIKSPEYQRLPAESSWEAQSPRVFEIKNLLESYRAAAFQKVLKEYPDLAKEDLRIYLTRRELKRGVDRRNPLEPR